MSDAPAGDPVELSGDVAPAGVQTESVEDAIVEPEKRYVEVDDPDNLYDRVKVDGEEIEVPYSEIKRGYSREADYTRKTQELARQRQEAEFGLRLQQAYQADPQATVRYLAEQAGITIAQAQQQLEPEQEYVDPLEREIAQERQARLALEQRLAQREMDEHVERTVAGLRQQFNANDEDIRDAIAVAMQGNYPVDALPMIYKAMALDKLQARVQAAQAAKAKQEAEETRRLAAKRQAAAAVTPGGTAGGNGLTNATQLQDRPSFREAALAAFDELEGRQT